jgi:hypothetical protein
MQLHTDRTPRFLGLDGALMFQSDVGQIRLSQRIHAVAPDKRQDLAVDAVRGLFEIHRAARLTELDKVLPAVGGSPDWVRAFVAKVDQLPLHLGFEESICDKLALAEFIGMPRVQFVKWDCRAGNAAIDETLQIRWFDFEYSGLRHGAEDFAWLIADENWPMDSTEMIAIVAQEYGNNEDRSWAEYCDYLRVYSCLQAIQRLLLILGGVQRKGWVSPAEVLHYDDVGINPHMAIHLCDNAASLAQFHRLTLPLTPVFEKTAEKFRATLQQT